MKNSNSILEIMLGDHALIDVLLISFKDTLTKDIEEAKKLFDEFRWELDKHIFVEEKGVFKFCDSPQSELCRITKSLIEEHDIMLGMLGKVSSDLADNSEVNISEFQELLTRHKQVEEKELYPKLDQLLSQAQKEVIIARINEVPLTKGEEE